MTETLLVLLRGMVGIVAGLVGIVGARRWYE